MKKTFYATKIDHNKLDNNIISFFIYNFFLILYHFFEAFGIKVIWSLQEGMSNHARNSTLLLKETLRKQFESYRKGGNRMALCL